MACWNCHGYLILVLLLTGSESAIYLGCYQEISIQTRLMSDDHRTFKDTLNSVKCITYCRSQGFGFAGLENGFECFCSRSHPSFTAMAGQEDCNMPCEGNSKEKCGGKWKLSVYAVQDGGVNIVQHYYDGCYKEEGGKNVLGAKAITFTDRLNPERCVGHCFRLGYLFAGLYNGAQCLCGDKKEGPKVADGSCNMKCNGDGRFVCGASHLTSVYRTSIPDESEDRKSMGCFIDNSGLRVLTSQKTLLLETNSPRRCMNFCKQLGFEFSGVEQGTECFCGNETPDPELETEDSECMAVCPGDKKRRCGGRWRLRVHNAGGKTSPPTGQVPVQEVPVIQFPTHEEVTEVSRPPIPEPPKPPSFVPSLTSGYCVRSATLLSGRTVCRGETLFEESFSGGSLDPSKWSHDIIMPWEPDYDFVTFLRTSDNFFMQNGQLHIRPTLSESDIRYGSTHLSRCTGRSNSPECDRVANAYYILPPIISARITTRDTFSFTYGTVHIRARLPVGDWIVPQLWLEPKSNTAYGPFYRSGRIQLAMARGNRQLVASDRKEIGVSELESGVVMGSDLNTHQIRTKKVSRLNRSGWDKDFHNFTFIWTPENLAFMVDGQDREDLLPPGPRRTLAEVAGFVGPTPWKDGSFIAPFDQEFYLTIGLSVGGMKTFPDGCFSNGRPKPWKNDNVKAMATFWLDKNEWIRTWSEDSDLQIEDIKIVAL